MFDIAKTHTDRDAGILALVRARQRVPETAGFLHCTEGDRPKSRYSSRRGLWSRPGLPPRNLRKRQGNYVATFSGISFSESCTLGNFTRKVVPLTEVLSTVMAPP